MVAWLCVRVVGARVATVCMCVAVSCVRAGSHSSIGFVDDTQRMNVALTRAKFALWVVGNSNSLSMSTVSTSLTLCPCAACHVTAALRRAALVGVHRPREQPAVLD